MEEKWHETPGEGFIDTVGGILHRLRDGGYEVQLVATDAHRNLDGHVHGGVIMTLVDRVVGMNVRHRWSQSAAATASLTVHFLRAARIGDTLLARCSIRKGGRSLCFVDAEVHVDDRLIATATGTFARTEAPRS
jgi:uncharacterized protein (TIGR00369 family)